MALHTTTLWGLVHDARRDLAEDLAGLTEAQWATESLCAGWSVEEVVAHLTAAASVGRWRWIRSIVAAGFRPAVHNERRLREQGGPTPADTLARFEAVVESRVAPSSDTAAYLGEVLVHGHDIRRPLGLPTATPVEAWTTVAEFYARRDFTVPSRSLTTGLRLRATDGPFEAGSGPEVAGPTMALVVTMAGRSALRNQLSGDGAAILGERIPG